MVSASLGSVKSSCFICPRFGEYFIFSYYINDFGLPLSLKWENSHEVGDKV